MESRKLLHIGMIGFSLGTGRLSSALMVAACLSAFLFNLFFLNPLSKKRFLRPEDQQRGFALGILMYPAILALLYLLFWQRPVFALVGWCAMAFGDGFGGLVGRRWGQRTWPWSAAKSWLGTFAFWFFGCLATLLWLCAFPTNLFLGLARMDWILIILVTMAIAAWIETLPGLIDDNFSVPLAAALTSWLAFQIHSHFQPGNLPSHTLTATVLITLLMGSAVLLRKITLSGSLVGGAIAFGLWLGFSWLGLGALFLFFWGGTLASHFGKKKKTNWGLAQENEGRRSIRHALANGAGPGLAGFLAWFFPEWHAVLDLAAVGGLSAALADTWSSEFGILYGRKFVHVLSFSPLQRGQDGAISLEGSLAGCLGAALMAGFWFCFHPGLGWMWVFLVGVFGTWIDSVLGITLQKMGYMTNDSVNFANTILSGVLAGSIGFLI